MICVPTNTDRRGWDPSLITRTEPRYLLARSAFISVPLLRHLDRSSTAGPLCGLDEEWSGESPSNLRRREGFGLTNLGRDSSTSLLDRKTGQFVSVGMTRLDVLTPVG